MSGQGATQAAGFNPITFVVGIWFYWPIGLLMDALGMTAQYPADEDDYSRSSRMLAYEKVRIWRNASAFLAAVAAVAALVWFPLVALPAALIASLGVARRYHLDSYGRGWQFVTRGLDAVPFVLSLVASVVGIGVAVNVFPDPKVGMILAGAFGGTGLVWLLVLAVKVPRGIAQARQAAEEYAQQQYAAECSMLDRILGVKEGTFMEARANNEAGVVVTDERWTLTPLPRAATDLIVMKGEEALRDRVAAVRPDLHAEIIEPDYVLLVPVPDTVRAERAHLKATGGLVAGSELLDDLNGDGIPDSQQAASWADLT